MNTFIYHCQGRSGTITRYIVDAQNQSEGINLLPSLVRCNLPYLLLRVSQDDAGRWSNEVYC